ncbi:MAG: efflux RND transporter periplasmic adaptor subunit [Alphaproteobacteria bacterium]
MRLLRQSALLSLIVIVSVAGWYVLNREPAGEEGGRRESPPVPVVAVAARLGPITDRIESVGTARAAESVIITVRQRGTIDTIAFTPGADVAAGDVLASLEATVEQAERDEVRAQRDELQRGLDRAVSLAQRGTVPQARVDELRDQVRAADARLAASQARLAEYTIRAPFAGRVGLRQVSPGAQVEPGTPITTLDDTDPILIEFSVPEIAIGALVPGLPVVALTPAWPDHIFIGQLDEIDTRVDPVSRSVAVRATFPNTEERLRPGMFLTVQLETGVQRDAILVPEEAVLPQGVRQFVYVVSDGKAIRTEVTLGRREPGIVQVEAGLSPGELVVVEGLQKVRDGRAVVLQEATGSGGATSADGTGEGGA